MYLIKYSATYFFIMEEEIYLKANVLYRLKETGDKVVPVDCVCVCVCVLK